LDDHELKKVLRMRMETVSESRMRSFTLCPSITVRAKGTKDVKEEKYESIVKYSIQLASCLLSLESTVKAADTNMFKVLSKFRMKI